MRRITTTLLAASLLACAPRMRSLDLTMHADTAFTRRADIEGAASRWRALTSNRARLTVAFDHEPGTDAPSQSLILGVLSTSDVAAALDATLKGPGHVAAATTLWNGRAVVTLVVDRISDAMFFNTVTHELGHAIGLPDLDADGAIMSRHHAFGAPLLTDWQAADVALCRSIRFCDQEAAP